MNNSKVIALHKGYLEHNPSEKINVGIPIELIIDKINRLLHKISHIKCQYEIQDNDNYIQIINNRDKDLVNEEIELKIKMLNGDKKENLIFQKKFNKKGIYTIYFIIE